MDIAGMGVSPSHGYETATRLPGTAAIGVNKPDVGQDRYRHIRVLADIKNRSRLGFALITTQPRTPAWGCWRRSCSASVPLF
ncbi:hypothetical protein V8C34DRAFT_281440 [Trichoderma compactum]